MIAGLLFFLFSPQHSLAQDTATPIDRLTAPEPQIIWTHGEWTAYARSNFRLIKLSGRTQPFSRLRVLLKKSKARTKKATKPKTNTKTFRQLPLGAYQTVKRDCVLRKTTSSTSQKIAVLKMGERFWMAKNQGPWYQVFTDDAVGFTSKSCLKKPFARRGSPHVDEPRPKLAPTISSIVLTKPRPNVQARSNGKFSLSFAVKKGVHQLPMALEVPGAKLQIFDLKLELNGQKAKLIAGTTLIDLKPVTNRKFWTLPFVKRQKTKHTHPKPIVIERKHQVTLGLAQTYHSFDQTSQDGLALNSEHSGFPALILHGRYHWSDLIDLEFEYHRATGNFSKIDSLSLRDDSTVLITTGLTARISPDSWQQTSLRYIPFHSHLTVGLKQQILPFFDQVTDSNFDLIDLSLIHLALGLGLEFFPHEKISYEAALSLRAPIASDKSVTVNGEASFDTSFGLRYKWTKNWHAGLFLETQLTQFNFVTLDPVLNREISGDLKLFYTNISGQIIYIF